MAALSTARMPFRRRPFTDRDTFKHLTGVFPGHEQVALIIEGRGGIGKSFFLTNSTSIIARFQGEQAQLREPLRVGAVDSSDPQRVLPLDMIYADMALPLTIEQMLIDCVEQVATLRERAIFADYKAARSAYEIQRRHLSFHDLRVSEQLLRTTFFDGWERLVELCGVPLIVSFDTCEYLERTRIGDYFKLAESEDVTKRGLGVRAQFFAWVYQALHERQLKQTYFIFGGRGVAGSELFRHLDRAADGRVLVEYLEGLDEAEVADYLGLAQRGLGDLPRARQIAHFITDGLPLKLDLLNELLDLAPQWCSEQLFGFGAAGQPDATIELPDLHDRFYNQALRRFFDPASYLDAAPHEQALGLCLVCLAYARCGATIHDLMAFIAAYGGVAPSAAELHRYLDDHALVKRLSPRVHDGRLDDTLIARHPQYFLHDQLWVDIDAIFHDTGINSDVWEFLSQRRSQAIRACTRDAHTARRIELMCEHLIVLMLSEPVNSYRYYTSYVDQALRHRHIDGAIVLSETFWRTLYYETSSSYGRFFPVLSALLGSTAIGPRQIDHDERVRHLRILSVPEHDDSPHRSSPSDQRASEALRQARELETSLEAAAHDDPYLWATLKLGVSDVLLTYAPYEPAIREYLRELIERLEASAAQDAAPTPDPTWRNGGSALLALRRDLILARAYHYRCDLNESLRHFTDAVHYARQGLAALDRYAARYRGELNDDITRDYVLGLVNLATALVRSGHSGEAYQQLQAVRAYIDEGRLSTYDQIVAYSRYALIGRDLATEEQQALGIQTLEESQIMLGQARKIGSRRALELASLAYLAVMHAQQPPTANDAQLQAVIAPLLDQHGALLVSPDLHDDLAHEIVCLYRNQFVRQPTLPTGALNLWPLQQAYRIIVDPRLEPQLARAHQDQAYRTVQYVDLVETRISLFSTLLSMLHRHLGHRGGPPTHAELEALIAQVSAGTAIPVTTLAALFATLDAIEHALLADQLEAPKQVRQNPFMLVVLGKIALQRGLLLHTTLPANNSRALQEFAHTLALAEQFSAAPFREKNAFRTIIGTVVAQHAVAIAALPLEPPAELLQRVPAQAQADFPHAWLRSRKLLQVLLGSRPTLQW